MDVYRKELEIVIFYTEILTGKVVLWCFFSSETSQKNPQFNFSSQNLSIEHNFSNEMEKKPNYYTYFSIEFGKIYLLIHIFSFLYNIIYLYCNNNY